YNQPDILPVLVQNGVDIEATIKDSEINVTPLFYSVFKLRSQSLALALLKNGANINSLTSNSWTPLMGAVYLGDKEMVKTLLINKAEVNKKGPYNWTALHFASRRRATELVNLL